MRVDLGEKTIIEEPIELILKGARIQSFKTFRNVGKALRWGINAYREIRRWIRGAEPEIKGCRDEPTALVRFESSQGAVLIMYHHAVESDHIHIIADSIDTQAARQIANEFINQCLAKPQAGHR